HRNARPGNTWLAKMNFGADVNSIHAANISLSRHKRQAAIGVHYSAQRQFARLQDKKRIALVSVATTCVPAISDPLEGSPLFSVESKRSAHRHCEGRFCQSRRD